MSYSILRGLVEVLSLSLGGARVLNLAGVPIEGEARYVNDVASADIVLCRARDLVEGELLSEVARDLGRFSIAIVVDAGRRLYLEPELAKDLEGWGLGVSYILSDELPALVYRRGYDKRFVSRAISVWRESIKEGPMPVSVNAARALYAIAKLVASRRGGCIVEVGAGLGFSTIFLAHACAECGAQLISIEASRERAARASEAIESLGLGRCAEVVVGDGKSADLRGRQVTMVFVDGRKREYADYLRNLSRFLAPRALVLAHNTLSHSHDVSRYLRIVYSYPYRSTTVALDPAGLTVSVKMV